METASDGRPLYAQVADDLRIKIADGAYPVGAELPSTPQLQKLYGMSSTVVRAAVRELRADGIVRGQPGRGVFVIRLPEATPSQAGLSLTELLEQVQALAAQVDELERRLSLVEASASHAPRVQDGRSAE